MGTGVSWPLPARCSAGLGRRGPRIKGAPWSWPWGERRLLWLEQAGSGLEEGQQQRQWPERQCGEDVLVSLSGRETQTAPHSSLVLACVSQPLQDSSGPFWGLSLGPRVLSWRWHGRLVQDRTWVRFSFSVSLVSPAVSGGRHLSGSADAELTGLPPAPLRTSRLCDCESSGKRHLRTAGGGEEGPLALCPVWEGPRVECAPVLAPPASLRA